MVTKSVIDWRSGSQQDTMWILASKLFCPPGLQRSAPGAATAVDTQRAGGNMGLNCFSPIPAAALCPFKCHCLLYTFWVSGRDILPKTKLHPEHQSEGTEKVRFFAFHVQQFRQGEEHRKRMEVDPISRTDYLHIQCFLSGISYFIKCFSNLFPFVYYVIISTSYLKILIHFIINT